MSIDRNANDPLRLRRNQQRQRSGHTSGVVTLVAGAATVSNRNVTAASLILLTGQNLSGTPGELQITAIVPGTSFTITSSNNLDTRNVAWSIVQ